MTTRRSVILSGLAAGLAAPLRAASTAGSPRIRQIDIVHHSHNDIGYTDLPSLCRELQVRFLDAALDTCVHDSAFRWTVESLAVLDDWWRASSAQRRGALLQAVRKGQMDVMALPFNQAPFLNARQWHTMLHWLPEPVWKQLNPRVGMQSDVNGFPRAGMLGLLDRGIRHLILGINVDSGGAPFPQPRAFWWQMPDGRKVFVWQGLHYGVAYSFFEPKNWQPYQARAASTTYRPARESDFLHKDEESLRKAHAHLMSRIASLEDRGYAHDRLILSYTGQWRYDNDAPWPPLSSYIAAWNKLGLQPSLRLTTMTQAMFDMEKSAGASVPTVEGEWTDWWANGDMSGPREVAASRFAKRYIEAAASPMWGPPPNVDDLVKDLCLFDEHTWGANVSVSDPDSLFTHGQFAEKSLTAYKPMGHAEFLLGQRVRTKLEGSAAGLHLANPWKAPYTGWARFELDALHGVELPGVEALPKKPWARVWVENLAPESVRLYAPVERSAGQPEITFSENGWPVAAMWKGAALFRGAAADFLTGSVPDRRTVTSLHSKPDEERRKAAVVYSRASYAQASRTESAHTILFEQDVLHPRLGKSRRTVELWKSVPRARFTMKLNRLALNSPEVFYVDFEMAAEGLPRFTNGGVPFTPYADQIPGTCRDYFAIDGWAQWNDRLWVTRDAPLVALGGPHLLERHQQQPQQKNRITAIVFDNCWHTNFVADESGELEYQFDLMQIPSADSAALYAEMLSGDPIVFWNSGAKESPEILDRIFK